MQRSGGKAGRPMAHLSIAALEATVSNAGGEIDELRLALAELGHRKTKRAAELRDLVIRLLDEREKLAARKIGPLFD